MAEPEDRSHTKIDDRQARDVESTVDDERRSPDETMVDTNDTTVDREIRDDPTATDPTMTGEDNGSRPPTEDDREAKPPTGDAVTAEREMGTDDSSAPDVATPAGVETGGDMGGSAGTAEHAVPAEAEMPPQTDDVEASADAAQVTEGAQADRGASVPGMREAAPGEIADQPAAELWPNEKISALRERWQEVQLHFVDDPTGAAVEADALVAEAVQTLTDSLIGQRQELSGWQGSEAGDTERLRVAVQRYRGFLDRLLGL
jgi:hypothetical protein